MKEMAQMAEDHREQRILEVTMRADERERRMRAMVVLSEKRIEQHFKDLENRVVSRFNLDADIKRDITTTGIFTSSSSNCLGKSWVAKKSRGATSFHPSPPTTKLSDSVYAQGWSVSARGSSQSLRLK